MSSTNDSSSTPTQGQDYVVGDIQGCHDELVALLNQVNFKPNHDHLWLTGDLVARGPKSLETLRLVKNLGNSATTVLGNHDLHLLATYHGIKKVKANDKLDALFAADDLPELIHWLKQQPLLQVINAKGRKRPVIMTHAGISPQWKIKKAIKRAAEIEKLLQSNQCVDLLTNMYRNSPNRWHKSLTGYDRYSYIINSFTRIRFCYQDGSLDFNIKCHPSQIKRAKQAATIVPWYTLGKKSWRHYDIAFGHWASLMGECGQSNIFALDTGCIWGNHLTMLRLSDNKLFTTSAITKIAL